MIITIIAIIFFIALFGASFMTWVPSAEEKAERAQMKADKERAKYESMSSFERWVRGFFWISFFAGFLSALYSINPWIAGGLVFIIASAGIWGHYKAVD